MKPEADWNGLEYKLLHSSFCPFVCLSSCLFVRLFVYLFVSLVSVTTSPLKIFERVFEIVCLESLQNSINYSNEHQQLF